MPRRQNAAVVVKKKRQDAQGTHLLNPQKAHPASEFVCCSIKWCVCICMHFTCNYFNYELKSISLWKLHYSIARCIGAQILDSIGSIQMLARNC